MPFQSVYIEGVVLFIDALKNNKVLLSFHYTKYEN